MTTIKRVFKVNGKPFYPLGRHRIYMAGYHVRDESEIELNFKASKLCNANTVCFAIFWDQLEPEEAKFDFSSVDQAIKLARKYDLKLILLLFATWKNGVMDYAPEYMKTNPKKYKRVIAPTGNTIWVLSSHCKATLEADKRAFAALCKHLKAFDGKEQTVIGLQVENEPGITGSDRDYGPEAQAEYNSPVPAKFMSAMKAAGKGRVYDIWQQAGGKTTGSWPELFGWEGGEIMTALSISSFINEVAKAGKAVYNLPMFINVALGGMGMPGERYSSGAAVAKTIDVYTWFAPYIDLFAPDNFGADSRTHELANAPFATETNPMFIVESHPDLNGMFDDIANFNAIGYFVHYDQNEECVIPPAHARRVLLTRSVAAAIPLLLKYQGMGKIQAVNEPPVRSIRGRAMQQMDLDGYWATIMFGDGHLKEMANELGTGLVIQADKHELYLVGFNFRLMLRPKPTLENMQFTLHGKDMDHPSYINFVRRVEEGNFDQNGKWVAQRRINGDDLRGGIWCATGDNLIRILTCD